MSATEILLIAIIVLLFFLIGLSLKRHQLQIKPEDIESAWQRSGLEQKFGQLMTYAEDVRRHHEDLVQMLRAPLERASLGELALEQILSDQLPSEMFGMRKRLFEGVKPDAYIRSSAGIICIDSKFPLNKYTEMVKSNNSRDKERLKKEFLHDVKGHLHKVATDYVRPEKGSAEFAFAFIPSESVYYFLVTEGYDLLRDFTKQGVQVVSPLTLSHKIELIKAGVHAQKLSEQAEEVQKAIKQLMRRFERIDEAWRTLQMHLENAKKKAEDLDKAYRALREEFDRIARHEQADRIV